MSLLLVPMRLDALIVSSEKAVCQPHANFNHLPYRSNHILQNPDSVYLAETVVSQPFNDRNLWLRAGVHLSWSLPQALLRAREGSHEHEFEQLPNRWLVIRRDRNTTSTGWVVESDYIWPEGEGSPAAQITVPWIADSQRAESQPFRFAGRAVPVESWSEDPTAERLGSLTALGYGIADFVSSYPNSFSLFGHYDNTVQDLQADLDGSTYQVIGWYSDRSVDPVALWRATAASGQLDAALLDRFGWSLQAETTDAPPAGLLVYGSLILNTRDGLDYATQKPGAPALENTETTVTVGNSAVEALAAHLAQQIDPLNTQIIEEQLDALALNKAGSATDTRKFSAALHRQGFTARHRGLLWQLTLISDTDSSALPAAHASALSLINQLQTQYNQAQAQIQSLRDELFCDWYKYMVATYPPDRVAQNYPDPDMIACFITDRDLEPLQAEEKRTGTVSFALAPTTRNFVDATAHGQADSIAVRLAAQLNALATALEQIEGTPWRLHPKAAQSYLSPAEPSLLLSGAVVTPVGSKPIRQTQGVPCQIVQPDGRPSTGITATNWLNQLVACLDTTLRDAADHQWTSQPWLPVAMEWQVQVVPLTCKNDDPIRAGIFSPDYVTSNFDFHETADLELKTTASLASGGGAMITGRSILSSHAPTTLTARLTAYIKRTVLPLFFSSRKLGASEQATFDLLANLSQISDWFEKNHVAGLGADKQASNLEWTALRSLARLNTAPTLTQRLTGFNAGLLGRRQTLQLPVSDPMGLPLRAAFTEEVARQVASNNRLAPQPHYTFLPIRTGALEIVRLRLVDRFGQSVDIEQPKATPAVTLSNPALPDSIYLPPRLAQASRLECDWLGARTGTPQSDSLPADSPICAWLMPNHLDNSLLVYDPAGTPIGAITQNAAQPWQALPSAPHNTSALSVQIPGMRKLAQTLVAYQRQRSTGQPSYLDNLLDVFERCSSNPAPTPGTTASSLPLMVGRPLAVVRMRLKWQLDGVTASDQGWNAFRLELQQDNRVTRGLQDITLPVTLGDPLAVANGVIGYWIETAEGYKDDSFHAPLYPSTTPAPDNAPIKVPGSGTLSLPLSIDGDTVDLTVIIDPRAPIYARSGVTPEHELHLSPALYAPVMNALAVTLFIGPLLTPQSELRLTLPSCPGATWTWYSMQSGLPVPQSPAPFTPNATYPGQRRICEGWVKSTS